MTDGVCQPWELPASGPAAICADRLQAMLPVLDTPRLTLRAPMLDDFATYAATGTGHNHHASLATTHRPDRSRFVHPKIRHQP